MVIIIELNLVVHLPNLLIDLKDLAITILEELLVIILKHLLVINLIDLPITIPKALFAIILKPQVDPITPITNRIGLAIANLKHHLITNLKDLFIVILVHQLDFTQLDLLIAIDQKDRLITATALSITNQEH